MRERRIRLEVRQVHVTRKSVGFLHVFLIPNSLVSHLLAALSGDTKPRNDGARVRLFRSTPLDSSPAKDYFPRKHLLNPDLSTWVSGLSFPYFSVPHMASQ